jgi:hypothetical protein
MAERPAGAIDRGDIDMNMMTSPVAANTDRSTWEAVVARWQATLDALLQAGEDDGMACELNCAAEIELMLTPAPDGPALLEKLDICSANDSFNLRDGGDKVWPALRADVKRLTAAGTSNHTTLGGKPKATESDEASAPIRLWETALADYRAKLAYSDALPEGDSREDAACDQYCLAQDRLIDDVPAPGPRELAIKIEMALKRAEDFDATIFDIHAKGIAADFHRLTGIGGFLDDLRGFEINGHCPLFDFGREGFGHDLLANALASLSILELTVEDSDGEFDLLNAQIRGGALRAIEKQIALAAYSLNEAPRRT